MCGTVTVDWSGHRPSLQRRYEKHYSDADGHRHVHGANLGVSSSAYVKAGGFKPLAFDEDVALVDALRTTGATIAWSAAPRVRTSARLEPRAPLGFGAYLRLLAAS